MRDIKELKETKEAIRKAIEYGLFHTTMLDPHDDEKWVVDALMNGLFQGEAERETNELGIPVWRVNRNTSLL